MNKTPVKTWHALLLALPVAASAGELYGAVTQDGRALANEPLGVACSDGATAPPGAVATDGFGAYRLMVTGEGSCRISVRGGASAEVRVFRTAQRYNFELKTVGGKPQLTPR